MSFSAFIPLTAAITNLALTLFVLTRDLRSQLNRVFLLWGLSIVVWNLGTFFMFTVEQPEDALFWCRFLHFGVIFIPVSMFHLALLVAQVPVTPRIRWLYGWFALLALLNLTPYFTAGVRNAGYAFYSVAGPGFWVFAVSHTVLVLATIVILYRKQARLQRVHRARIESMLLANGILILFGFNDILPILGYTTYPLINKPIFPFGSAAAIFYGIIVGYSVLQHHLLDIHVTLGKAAAHAVRLLFLFLVGLLLLLLLNVFRPGEFTGFTFFGSLVVLLVSALVASIFFPRLFGKGDESLEQRILSDRYGDRFEYHDKVRSFLQEVQFYNNADLLLNDLDALFVKTIRVRNYQIILLDESTHVFTVFRGHPKAAQAQLPELRADSPIFQLFQNTTATYLAFNLAYIMPGETEMEREARQLLKRFEPEFCFPFFSGDEPFGLLLIGEKTSGTPYTPNDLQLLTRLVKNLSLILNQIRLKKQVLLAEELELLGRMSRGMAHDLNNLLTPVSTFLQITKETANGSTEGANELLPTCLRNVGTIQAYVKDALFFSQNHTVQISRTPIDQLIHKVIELAEPKLKRRQVRAEVPEHPPTLVEMDAVLMQRCLGNILSNAIDASPVGATVRIELQNLAAPEAGREWVRVRVIDHGEGISRENLQRLTSAYFTTKDSGDENRGFGLGLAICRKIVHQHGGNLNIASEEKKGTTVTVDLPVHFAPPSPPPNIPLEVEA
ncbi:MAG: Integral membrane sensor signal transduction histidine kinase [Limisphaerales bacterium]|nr:MAG: Integral membrane sensor signal transduction histidine kinase [Limisphaerales bacterium]KAG0507684.1 MAG: Integral membrane sensor signal transduction histidine kinase [Limisphaerales bacterium]TXT52444.1 MAG: Integral membrane sensor signal transduction histidine kinase [Limisphaerales bacterium]